MMKVIEISREKDGKEIKIKTETKRMLWLKPKIRTFVANREYPKGYWNWLELPNKTLVETNLKFQLDEWLKFSDEI